MIKAIKQAALFSQMLFMPRSANRIISELINSFTESSMKNCYLKDQILFKEIKI